MVGLSPAMGLSAWRRPYSVVCRIARWLQTGQVLLAAETRGKEGTDFMTKRILWALMIVAAIIGLAVGMERMHVEGENRQVEITVDWPAAQQMAAVTGQSLHDVLTALGEAGVYSAAVMPRTMAEFGVSGRDIHSQAAALWSEFPQQRDTMAQQPVGFWEEDLQTTLDAGLAVVPRVGNPPWGQDLTWSQLEPYGPHLVIFGGRDAAGYPDDLDHTQDALQALGARAGVIEFANQRGLAAIAANNPAVRVHGISAEEMKKLSSERVLARYLRAVRERNIRVLYFRGFTERAEDWERTLNLVQTLSAELTAQGYTLGPAEPFVPWQVPPTVKSAAWLGLGAGFAILMSQWVVMPSWLLWVLTAVPWLSLTGMLLVRPDLAAAAAALAAALVFPTLAVVQIPAISGPRLRMVAHITGISLIGALIIITSLGGTEYMLKLAEFRGVKLMHVVPVAAAIVFGLLWKQMPVRRWQLVRRRLDELWNASIPVKQVLLAGFFAMAAFVYLQRTGNFGLPALEWEIQFREMLERVLLARPRTKELFLGHPALWWAGASLGRWSWWIPVAAVGQLSVVNTFTHIHTPLMISILRTMYGLSMGLALGWILEIIWNRFLRRWIYDSLVRILRVR